MNNVSVNVKYAVASNQEVVYDDFGDCFNLSIHLSEDVLKRTKEEAIKLMEDLQDNERISIEDKRELHVVQIEFCANIKKV